MAVRFKLDENLPRDTAVLLRDAGHDVQTVLEQRLGGSPDPKVLEASTGAASGPFMTFGLVHL